MKLEKAVPRHLTVKTSQTRKITAKLRQSTPGNCLISLSEGVRRTLIDVFLPVKGQKAHPKHFSRQNRYDALYLKPLLKQFLKMFAKMQKISNKSCRVVVKNFITVKVRRIEKALLFFWMAFFLVACRGGNPIGTPTLPATPTGTPVPLPTSTSQPLTDCVAMNAIPTSEADEDSLFPPVSDADRVLGVENAAVTFTVYCDLQSDGCATLLESLDTLHDEFENDVRVVYRDYPQLENPGHELSGLAAQAVHAARLQGGDWDLQALLFATQTEWGALTESAFVAWVADQAATLGMDGEQLQADLQSDALASLPVEAYQTALEIGIPGTPFLLFNHQIYYTAMDLASLRRATKLTVLGARQFATCPPSVVDFEKRYLAYLETEYGEVIIQLYPQEAPVAVNNFVFLAREGWFDGVTFHRVVPGLLAQTGDPSGTGLGSPGYFFADEIGDTLLFDKPGVVAMANVGADTNGSQFFITYAAAPALNGRYTIFGQVIAGMDVLAQLSPREEAFGEILPPGDLLLSVRIEEN